jgi:hypothetical protein
LPIEDRRKMFHNPIPRRRGYTKRGLGIVAAVLATATVSVLVPSAAKAAVNHPPIGHLDRIVNGGDHATLIGWAADPNNPTRSIDVEVTYDTTQRLATSWPYSIAHDSRPDVARAHPELGANHGFAVPLTVDQGGTFRVCVQALSLSARTAPLGCATVTVTANRSPIGHLDSVHSVGNNHIQIVGWAADLDTPKLSGTVNLLLGGSFRPFNDVRVVASRSRPDVAKSFPELGPNHGFVVTIAANPGTYPVCAYTFDTGRTGTIDQLGCITVTV